MVLDAQYLIDSIEAAAKEVVQTSLDRIVERAKDKAPVRKIHADQTARRRGFKSGAVDPIGHAQGAWDFKAQTTLLNETKGPAFHWASRAGFDVQQSGEAGFSGGRDVATPGSSGLKRGVGARARQHQYAADGGRVIGRINSLSPVLMSPAGRIGGQALRRLSEVGFLQVQTISHKGGTFSALDLLSARGRYELKSGRAAHLHKEDADDPGQLMLGGTLRDSIKREGPYVHRDEVYGFVSAAAFNEQGFNYALAQEVGTGHNRPQPYLRPALRELHDDIVGKQAKGIFGRAFAGSGGAKPRGTSHFKRMVRVEVSFDLTSFERAWE
jgi:hypothetical protein